MNPDEYYDEEEIAEFREAEVQAARFAQQERQQAIRDEEWRRSYRDRARAKQEAEEQKKKAQDLETTLDEVVSNKQSTITKFFHPKAAGSG